MPSGTFVVDRRLEAIPLAQMLEVRAQLKVAGAFEARPLLAADRPVFEGGQALVPNTLYPAEKNASLRYYLPEYRVAMDEAGRPSVELRYEPGEADELGRLTVSFTWTPPQAAGLLVRVMDHVTALTLRFHVPVQDAAGGTAAGGGWEHTVPLQPAQQAGHLLARSTTVFREKSQFDMVYQALRSQNQRAVLELQTRARVGMRTWRQVIVGRPTELDQARALRNRGALFTEMVHAESFAELRAVPQASSARIHLATAPPEVTLRVDATRVMVAEPEFRRATGPTPILMRRTMAGPQVMTRARVMPRAATVAGGVRVATPARSSPAAAPAVAAATRVSPAFERATLSRVNTPKLSHAIAMSDLTIDNRTAVPNQMVLDSLRRPAIVDTELQNQQSLPFWFDPAKRPQHEDVYAVAGFDSGGIHLLLPLRLTAPDGSAHVVYQDNLMRDVVHVAPSEFRLQRENAAPYLPALTFLASEFSTADTGNDDEADVLFRVAAVYRLEPWLDPDVIELARAELKRQGLVARFTTSLARDAKLALDLDLLGVEQQRTAATVDPAAGITDTLELDHATFLRVWREYLTNPSGSGIGGHVQYQLFDGSDVQVRVRISLRETSSELFDVSFRGPLADQPGRYRISMRNRVESAARITELPAAVFDAGVARAVDPGAFVGQLLQPQETREIAYEVTGELPPEGFEPIVLAQVDPNLPALLKLLMLTPGYASLGFSVVVKAAANAFAPRQGSETLTGLLVEFDDGTRGTLTPSQPQVDVTLVGRLLDQILGTGDDSQRYFYRVTNMHAAGEGARTSWLEGQGSAPLEIGVAAVRLDF